ncbi:hypothetical protein H0E87_031714 [Populus deltoides]|uniref:Uncharacterized protein n=1 Tax=Populus deltoides TaxID=3696 RepID=A0A8T2WFP7_POPDE|nr:hypothetical protein H0E87_031714 [Populus deltoides]
MQENSSRGHAVKQRWFSHGGGSGSQRDSVGRFGSSVCSAALAWDRQSQRNRQSRRSAESAASAVSRVWAFYSPGLAEKTVGPDKGPRQPCQQGKIGSADFWRPGWAMGCPGHAGKFVQGTRCEAALSQRNRQSRQSAESAASAVSRVWAFYSPGLGGKDCCAGFSPGGGSGSQRDSVGRFGSSVCSAALAWDRQSQRNRQSRRSAESAASAVYESGRFTVQGLAEKTVGPDKGPRQCHASKENRQRQIFLAIWAGRWAVQAMQENSSRGRAVKQRWFSRGGGSGSQRDSVGGSGSSVCSAALAWHRQSQRNRQSRRSAESAASAVSESGRFTVQGLAEKTVGPDKGRGIMPARGKSAAQIFLRHGLGDGLSRPGRKIRPGDALAKQRWFSRGGGSGSQRDSVGRFGSRVCSAALARDRQSQRNRRSAAGAGDESGRAGWSAARRERLLA